VDEKAKKIIAETDLTQNGLQQTVEIKEAGTYYLKIADKLGNETTKKIKI